MAFVKRYVVWIILALILAGEAGLTFVLLGKQQDARQKLETLAKKENTLTELEAKNLEDPARRKELEARRDNLVAQRGKCGLYFWARNQHLQSLFDDPKLKDARKPWDAEPRGLSDFKVLYSSVYNEEVDKLLKRAGEKLQVTRASVPFASDTGFAKADVTIGDVYAEQKEFWIRKEVVELALRHNLYHVAEVLISRKPDAQAGRGRAMVTPGLPGAAPKKATLVRPIAVEITVQGQYPNLSGFVADLLRSPLSFRLKSVTKLERGRPEAGTRAGRAAALRPAPRVPDEMMLDMPPGPGVGAERGLEAGVPMPPMPVPGAGRVPIEPGFPEGGQLPSTPAVVQIVEARLACEVSEFNLGLARARFSNPGPSSKDAVREWLQARLGEVTPSPERTLWVRTLAAVDDPALAKEEGGAVEITFRPKDHFSPDDKHAYKQSFGYQGVEVEFRLVTFEPRESAEGVAKARQTL